MHPQQSGQPVRVPDWLAVPELQAVPADARADIAQAALLSATQRHPPGYNLPALICSCVFVIATLFAMGLERPGAGRLWFVFLPVAATEFVASMLFGWWWWRVAFARHFRRVVRVGIGGRADA